MLTLNKKKKAALSALAATALVLPVSVLAVNKINSAQDTHAANVPSGFNDQILYDCVLAEFQAEFPNESVASTGLTDAQLAKIKTVWCPGSDNSKITDATGIEKMTGVTGITLNKNNLRSIDVSHNQALIVLAIIENQISSLDVSHNPELMNLRVYGNQLSSLNVSSNPKLEVLLAHNNPLTSIDITNNPDLTDQFTVDDILVKANIEPITTTITPSYSLAELNILGDNQTIDNTSNYTYNSSHNNIIVNNYAGAGGYAQVSSVASGKTYKLQLPKFLKFDANEGTNGPSAEKCFSELANGTCSVTIPREEPTKSGYELKGYADSSDAENADYTVGDSVTLSEPKTVYAVWGKEDPDQTPDSDKTPDPDQTPDSDKTSDSDADTDSEGDISVPNTSGGLTPETGGNFATDGNSATGTSCMLPVSLGLGLITLIICCVARRHNRIKL